MMAATGLASWRFTPVVLTSAVYGIVYTLADIITHGF